MPTVTIPIAATANDALAVAGGSVYPPSGTPSFSNSETPTGTLRTSFGFGFTVRNGLLRFDTSVIPSDATVISAKLKLRPTVIGDVDKRSITADYYNWPSSSAAYSLNAQTGAISGVALSSLTQGADNEISLQNVGNIAKGGQTALRLHISGGQPSGDNSVYFLDRSSPDATDSNVARLEVTYDESGGGSAGLQQTFNISRSEDDVLLRRTGSSYPPTGALQRVMSSPAVNAGKYLGSGTYTGDNALLSWDTSSIPDDAVITSASLVVSVIDIFDRNDRSVVGDWRVPDGTDSDYLLDANGGVNAVAPVALSSFTAGQSATIPLSNVSEISKTGITGIRLGVTGGTPTANNRLGISSFDDTTRPNPKLIVNYELPPIEDSLGILWG